jgi:hypothetical protein
MKVQPSLERITAASSIPEMNYDVGEESDIVRLWNEYRNRVYERCCSVSTIVLVPVVIVLIAAIASIWITRM